MIITQCLLSRLVSHSFSIRASRDKPRERNPTCTTTALASFPLSTPYFSAKTTPEYANCMTARKFCPRCLCPFTQGLLFHQPHRPLSYLGKIAFRSSNLLQERRASYPPQSFSFVFHAHPRSPQTLPAPYPRRRAIRRSKRTSSPIPAGPPPRSDPLAVGLYPILSIV